MTSSFRKKMRNFLCRNTGNFCVMHPDDLFEIIQECGTISDPSLSMTVGTDNVRIFHATTGTRNCVSIIALGDGYKVIHETFDVSQDYLRQTTYVFRQAAEVIRFIVTNVRPHPLKTA